LVRGACKVIVIFPHDRLLRQFAKQFGFFRAQQFVSNGVLRRGNRHMAADRRSSDFGAIGTLGGTTAIPGSGHLGMTRERRTWILAVLGFAGVGADCMGHIPSAPGQSRRRSQPFLSPRPKRRAGTWRSLLLRLERPRPGRSVAVFAQVSGQASQCRFTEGTDVQAGQVLAQIDPGARTARC